MYLMNTLIYVHKHFPNSILLYTTNQTKEQRCPVHTVAETCEMSLY